MSAYPKSKRGRGLSLQEVLAGLGAWAISFVTVAGLVAVGWLGHATHWSFGLGGQGGHGPGPHGAAEGGHEEGGRSPPDAAGTVRFPSREALERTGIEVVPVERRPLVSELLVAGVVDYDERRTAQLSSRVDGSIWRVEKHLGDVVRRGEVLLVIDSQAVGALKADFLNALVTFESRREQLAILEEVQGAVMGRQLREARAALREARIHLVNAEQALVNLGLPVSIADYESLGDEQRAERIRTVGLPQSLLSDLAADPVTSNLLPLYASFDGVVVGRDAVVGEVVESAKPIFEVADVSRMMLVLKVDKEDADKVVLGQPVRFRPDGSNEEYASRITWIATEVDEATRTLRVRAEVENRSLLPVPGHAGLRAHTFGSGRIEIDRRGTAVVVPQRSVQWDGRRWVVFVPEGDVAFAPHEVRPGIRDGDAVEIVGDPADVTFERVVGSGSHVLKSQMLLERMETGDL